MKRFHVRKIDNGRHVPGQMPPVTAVVVSSSEIDLSWNPVTGASAYTLRRNGSPIFSGSVFSFNDTGLSPITTYNYTISAINAFGESTPSVPVAATTLPSSGTSGGSYNPDFPRTSWHGTGGTVTDLFWNNPTVTVMRLGSIPILKAYGMIGVFCFGEDYEGFAHDFNATLTTIKASSTTQLGTRVGKYGMAEETFLPSDTTNYPGYKTWADVLMPTSLVSTGSNFLAYASGSSGTPVNAPDGSTRALVNYGENSSGVPYAGFTKNIGQTWTPAQWAAFYQFYKTLNKTRTGPIAGLFTNCNVLAASALFDFVDMDNIFVYWGVVADIFRNGTQSPVANELTYSGTYSDALANGQARMFRQMAALISAAGGSQWLSGNSGAYARIDLGNTQATAGAMWQVQNSGFWETVIGKPNALELQLTPAQLLACYQHYLDFLAQPKVLRLNLTIPNGTGAGVPWSATPTAVNGMWQWARYEAAFGAMNNGWPGIQLQTSAYNLNGADLVWLDEYDNASTNMAWLGPPVDPPQTAPYVWADGSSIANVYARRFKNGIAIWVSTTGKGSATQPTGTITITGAQLGISAQPLIRINGTQAPAVNSGVVVTSAGVTMQASRDGLFLINASTNTNTDYSYSGTLAAPDIGSQAGYVFPGKWAYGTTKTPATYQGGPIMGVQSTGNYDLYLDCALGAAGARTVTATTVACTNMTAGTNFVSVTNSITVPVNQVGRFKALTINVTAMPSGFGLIRVDITGSAAYRGVAWLCVYNPNGSRVTGAKFFQSSNGVKIAPGAAGGSGTQASPWTSLQNAISQMGSSGGVLYWLQNGTNGHQEWNGAAASGGNGVIVNSFNAPANNPLIILPDPGNTVQALMDQGCTGVGGSSVLWSNAPALYYHGSGSNMHVWGIRFTRGGLQYNANDLSGAWSNNVIWQCQVDNWAVPSSAGSNIHCIRCELTDKLIIQDLLGFGSYAGEAGTANNPYTGVPSGCESIIGELGATNLTIAHCVGYVGQHFLIHKDPGSGTAAPYVTNCLASKMCHDPSSGGQLVAYPVQGGTYSNGLIRNCVYDGTHDTVVTAGGLFNAQGSTKTATFVDIINCVSIAPPGGGLGGLISPTFGLTNLRAFNCVSQFAALEVNIGTINHPNPNINSQLEISDYHLVVNTAPKWQYNYSGTTTTVSGLANWQATGPNTYLANNNDLHSTVQTSAPAYGNIATGNYRFTDSGGLLGRPRGVGDEFVGIVNNFLNPSLPLAG